MRIFKFERSQTLPISIDDAWDYFSNPLNLSAITPPELGLKIKVNQEAEIYNGMMIEYTVKPLGHWEMDWVSEIKHVNKPYSFVDEQRIGPYKIWYHQHFLKPMNGKVEIIDRVYYALPMGLFASLLNQLLIIKKLETIFDYRKKVLALKFT